MKLLSKDFFKRKQGAVALLPQEPEDMWHAYNLIREGDIVNCSTLRKVLNESEKRASSSKRVRTNVAIEVESMEFDSQAYELRLKGKNVIENPFVKVGAYHSLRIEINQSFELRKDSWDLIDMERLRSACATKQSDVYAVIMQEGLANICLITSNLTLVCGKIEMDVAHKRSGRVKQYEKSVERFFELVMQAMLRHIKFNNVKCILIASPGNVRQNFFNYIYEQATRSNIKALLSNKDKFLLVQASSGLKSSLNEILKDPVVLAKMSSVKAVDEMKALEEFSSLLKNNPSLAIYGKKQVSEAASASVIDTLLICDDLFRCTDNQLRQEYVDLVKSVRKTGGKVNIFSNMHVSGEKLAELTGVAAILRFAMPIFEDGDEKGSSIQNILN